MRGIAGRRLAAVIALGLFAVGVFLVSRLLAAKGLAWAANVTQIASFALAAATPTVLLLGKMLGWLSGAPPVSKITLAKARQGFAAALKRQWAEEHRLRQVNDPWPLPVRWRSANGETEEFTSIYAAFMRTPAHRMVIVGAAGAGKSVLAIQLVRDLLRFPKPGDRVPVLLPAATWTRDGTLTEWITEQLVRSQPNLDVRISTGTGEKVWLPRALADSGLIPVIDGLDELPQDRWATVISEINDFGSDYPLVLTSRPEEYHAAVAGREISQAVMIELEPLPVPEIKRYLTEATEAPADRWRGVFDRLDAEPGGVLAQSLATPLMIWLARTVYQVGESDPDELLNPVRLADRETVESHLVAAFVPAAYAAHQTQSRPRAFRCTPEQATRWLGFLANRLDRSQAQDIAWWQLALAGRGLLVISRSVRAVLYTCIFWLVSVWALTRRGYWRHGAYTGHGHYQDLLLAGPLGHAVRTLPNAGIRGLASGPTSNVGQLSADIDGALRGVAHLGLFPLACIAAGCGVLGGVSSVFTRSTPAPQALRMTWRKFWRQLLAPLPWLAVLAFVWWDADSRHQTPLAVLRSPAGWPVLAYLGLTLAWLTARSLKTPIEVAASADPVGLLRADRRTYLAGMAGAAISVAITWLFAGGVFAIADGIRSALDLVVVLLLGGTAGAWVCYVDARLRLAALRRLPWRTISFLDDAYRRGVLRQTGAVYQFRHIRLQQQLAAGYSPWPGPVAPVAAWTGRQLARLRSFFPLLVAEPVSGPPGADVGAAAAEYTAPLEGNARWPAQAIVLLLQVLVMVAMFFIAVFVLPRWIAVLIVIADVLLIPTVILAVDKIKASANLPADRWSVHVAPGEVEVTQGPHRIRLTPDDVERIAVRPIGDCQFSYAVQAKLRPRAVPSGQEPKDWFPLFWTPRYTARVPRSLVSALAGFADGRLDRQLYDWQSRQAVVDYEASGTLEVKSISGTLGPHLTWLSVAALAMTVIFLLVGWNSLVVLAIIADVILIAICGNKLTLRAARKRLPSGPWSFRVHADAIEVTRAGRTIRLSPGDIESIEFHSIRGSSAHKAVYARLRSGAAGRLHVMDGWYPLYWSSDFSTTVPPGLLVALGVFGSGRLAGSLKRKSARALARAPVYRGS